MSDSRREKIPFYPFVILLFAIAIIVIAGGYYVSFPSETKITLSILVTGIVLAIIAFVCRPKMFKEIFVSKKTALWINDIIFILMIIGIGVLLAHIGFRRNFRYDVTKNKMFSLSELTIKIVRELDKEVKIYGFFPKDSSEENLMLDLFKQYKRHSDKLSYVMIDPQRDPITAQKLKVTSMFSVVVECEANKQIIPPNDLFYSPNPYTRHDDKDMPKFLGEQAITSAISNVLHNEKTVISFITGHEESSIKGFQANDIAGLNQLLISENFDIVENSLVLGEIDDRAKVVLVVAPKKDFLEEELAKLKKYIESKKGNIIFALDPNPNLKKLTDFIFKEYAVSTNYDYLIDPQGILNNYWSVAPLLANHEITKPMISKNLYCLMFQCCSLTRESRSDVKHTVLLKTIDRAYSKRDITSGKEIDLRFDKNHDLMGPFDLGIIAQKTNTASGSQALILSDSDFMGNRLLGIGGNRDLVLNMIHYFAGNQKMLSIRPRTLELPRIQFKASDSVQIFILCVIGFPLMIIFIGGLVYFTRRRV